VTEKVGKRVDRINPADGSKTTVLTIDQVSASGAQDGLLGLAFAGSSAFLAYSYDTDPGPPTTLRGKIVRYQYDRAAATLTNPVDILDGSVPADNPVIHGVRSHVFTYGHRNPQGLVVGPGGRIFSDEHGPKSDDEINLLRAGKNYGWPFVAGYRDGQSYQYSNWSAAANCAQLEYNDYDVPAIVPRGPPELRWQDPDYAEPLKTICECRCGAPGWRTTRLGAGDPT